MKARPRREMTVEEYQAYYEAERDVESVMEAAVEEGGPRVTMVPNPVSVPIDILPDEVSLPAPVSMGPVVPFHPQASRKTGGWSAVRQRLFIETLAETGVVHMAAKAAGLSARSAYSLRIRSAAFAAAWDAAQQLAVGRLSALAFDRAIHGRIEQVYHDGQLIGEKRVPSERLQMWLLTRLDPKRFAAPWERRAGDTSDPQAETHKAFPGLLGALTDVPAD